MTASWTVAAVAKRGLWMGLVVATLAPMRMEAHCNLSYSATNAPVCVGETVVIEQTGRDCVGNTNTVYHQFSYSSPQVVTNCPDCTGCEAITNIIHCAIFTVVGVARVETNFVLSCPGIITNFTAIALPDGASFPNGKPVWRVEPTNAGSVTPSGGPTTTFTGDTNFVGNAFVIADGCGSAATATVSALVVDLDIDSDNNNGTAALPDRSQAEEDVETTGNGKFIFVNHNDDDNDSIPDFADKQVTGEGNLVPIIVSVSQPLDWSQATLQFDYAGPTAVDLVNTLGQDLGHGYTNYHTAALKQNTIRLWSIGSPAEERTSAKYIVPGTTYTAQTLGFTGTKTFYVEGINPGAGNITVTLGPTGCIDTVKVTTVEPNIGVNCGSEDLGLLRAGTPDDRFRINQADERVEDQQGGFKFWWSRDSGGTLSAEGLVDLAPLTVELPANLITAGFIPMLQIQGGASVYLYPAASDPTNWRQFLRDTIVGSNQFVTLAPQGVAVGVSPVAFSNLVAGINGLVFKVNGGSGAQELTFRLVMAEPGASGNQVVSDSLKVTVRDAQDYWHFVSARGSQVGGFTYHGENGGTFTASRYPNAANVAGSADPVRTEYLVFVHGYANSQSDAQTANNEYFKRLYWLGYRGNYVGFAWEGDEWDLGLVTLFDPNVENAFQSAESLRLFVAGLSGSVGANNVNLMAHSLGNLVAWEALRTHRIVGGGQPLCRTLLSVEAAVWRDCWEPHASWSSAAPSVPATYSTDQLRQHSWRFWFTSPGNEATGALALGRAFNSYVDDDAALVVAMRLNDYVFRGLSPFLVPRFWHFHRQKLYKNPAQYRQQFASSRSLASHMPALMQPNMRIFPYGYVRLAQPVGAAPNASPVVDDLNAKLVGWPKEKHSAFRDEWLPQMHQWYDTFIRGSAQVPLGKEF